MDDWDTRRVSPRGLAFQSRPYAVRPRAFPALRPESRRNRIRVHQQRGQDHRDSTQRLQGRSRLRRIARLRIRRRDETDSAIPMARAFRLHAPQPIRTTPPQEH